MAFFAFSLRKAARAVGKSFSLICGIGPAVSTPAAATETETVLWDFDGYYLSNPKSGLVFGPGGVLYGATFDGGAGTVFQLTPPAQGQTHWTETRYTPFVARSGESPNNPTAI
ncbi:hypothetical protein [Methylocystis heyeri]|uniref:Uncharacterized protein n=1 Tax=Methylocystis heyeri TaxID=391905 RepID=A0A6B8KD23_9HYPH|nr:hypothetical protein [Methylocystis heyeri]QGM46314.1 hypothetical protein H2LOC_011745 [Methylocystis heyeri]